VEKIVEDYKKFKYRNIDEIIQDSRKLNLNLALDQDISVLKKSVLIGKKLAPNGLCILPMEGCDSELDGSPSMLVERRYKRFAEGGAGLIWWEANAVVKEGKANDRQMMMTEKNMHQFRSLLRTCNELAEVTNGYKPLNILQLTHSGRYSRPTGHTPAPIIAFHDPILDKDVGLTDRMPVVSDKYLSNLVSYYVASAKLAKEAGFDGVDIKSCHRYLLSELLAAHTRKGIYGGSFGNRTRLLVTIIRKVREALGDSFIIASRINVYDAHPYPYGFGMSQKEPWSFDQEEPIKLVKLLKKVGVDLLSNSAGNPYGQHPHVTRPSDTPSTKQLESDEHPLVSVNRLFEFTRIVQEAAGDVPVIGSGYTWLRQFLPYVGSANIRKGYCTMMGLGRTAFAYFDAPKDILTKGEMEAKKCCITCSKCTQIMRDHGRTGCVIRDAGTYLTLMEQAKQEAIKRKEGK